MNETRLHGVLGLVTMVLSLVSAAGATEAPMAVSPGEATKLALVEGRCPTFSWSAVPGARAYDLVVYRLGGEGAEARPVLRQSFARSAFSWTPSLDRCLDRGGRYAWSVRALASQAASDWSLPSLFQVAAGPTPQELEQALAVVRSHRAQDSTTEESSAAATKTAVAETDPPARPAASRPWSFAEDSPRTLAPPLGTASLSVDGQIHLGAASAVFKEGSLLLWADSSTSSTSLGLFALDENFGFGNTAVGGGALSRNEGDDDLTPLLDGAWNTAVGYLALFDNDTGSRNTAVGCEALANNLGDDPATSPPQEGSQNTAVGYRALRQNTTGLDNTGVGNAALGSNVEGARNVGIGAAALSQNQNGNWNTAVGEGALRNLNGAGADFNVAVGAFAGSGLGDLVNPENSNILFNSSGVSGESHTLRIGESTSEGERGLVATYIHGIYGKTVATPAGPVYIDSTGKLGTVQTIPLTGGAPPEVSTLGAQVLEELERLQREIRELQAEVARLRSD